jgi:hypothetical protein
MRIWMFILIVLFSSNSIANDVLKSLREYKKCVHGSYKASKYRFGLSDQAAGELAFDHCGFERSAYLELFPAVGRETLATRLQQLQNKYILERKARNEVVLSRKQRDDLKEIRKRRKDHLKKNKGRR